ncbi:hypothetical protein BFW01_g5580 [Lasiodiplodia theobromae]|nr:hypothetical protein BFW01_g5580 [Lasiodiplodia theobromae]
MFQPTFAQVVQDHRAQSDIKLNYTGCRGSCDITLVAAGLDVDCSYGTLPFNASQTTRTEVFVGSLTVNSPGQIKTNITYKDTTACSGTLKTVQCTLSAATIAYPLRITNGSAQLLPADSTNNNNNTIRLQDPSELYEGSSPTPGMGSTYGGLALAIAQQFPQSEIDLYFTMQWAVEGQGTMKTTYLSAASQDAVGKCNMAWTDPTPDILLFARGLMFRSAVKASSSSDSSSGGAQTYETFEKFDRTVYTSNYAYLVGALAVVVADVFVLLPLLWGWWLLGRSVSLSPVEIAKAFRAPMVAEAESNASVDALLGQVGRKKVEYGFVPVAVGEDDSAWMLENGGRAVGKEEDEKEGVEMVGMSGGSAGVLCFSKVL